jgi:hypothetical protein
MWRVAPCQPRTAFRTAAPHSAGAATGQEVICQTHSARSAGNETRGVRTRKAVLRLLSCSPSWTTPLSDKSTRGGNTSGVLVSETSTAAILE